MELKYQKEINSIANCPVENQKGEKNIISMCRKSNDHKFIST